MQYAPITFDPHLWMIDRPPEYTNVWLFKTNNIRGHGEYLSSQRCPSGITLRILAGGRWSVKMSGGDYSAKRGDIFLALPGIHIVFAQHDPEIDWEWYELQFNGTAAENFVREFGVDEQHPVATPRQPEMAMQLFMDLQRLMGECRRNALEIMSTVFRLTLFCGNPLVSQSETTAKAEDLMTQAITLLETDHTANLNVNDIAQRLGVDRSTLGRAFKNCGASTPHEILDYCRMLRVQDLLGSTGMRLAEIARVSGFRDEKYFISWFRRKTGMTPGKWRKKS